MFENSKLSPYLSVNQLILTTSVYFLLVFNSPFLLRFANTVTALNEFNPWFIISVPFLLLSVLIVLFSLCSLPALLKPALILLTLVSSLVFYGALAYGVVFDYSMIQNVIETDGAESLSYLSPNFIVVFVLSGVLPALWIYKAKLQTKTPLAECLQRVKLVGAALIALIGIAYFFYADYAAIGRNNRQLQQYIVPTQYLSSAIKYTRKNYLTDTPEFQVLDHTPTLAQNIAGQKQVLVLVVGETARSKNFAYNNYHLPTNNHTEQFEPISFKKMYACGTATAISVPCMFSALTQTHFDNADAANQQNMLDIAKLAGADVLWIENNSGCKGVCERVETITINPDEADPLCDGQYCFDAALLGPLKQKLQNLHNDTTVVVLHMIGSHGPTYYRRYPQSHRQFLPDCQRSDIQNCTELELSNTYDNTIAYTDFVLARVIEQLSGLPHDINAAMMYVSDHGESLGEGGIYLHGFPYALSPVDQRHIPMLVWLSHDYRSVYETCLRNVADNQTINHDYIFHSVMGLAGIKTRLYEPKLDLFEPCTANLNKLRLASVGATPQRYK